MSSFKIKPFFFKNMTNQEFVDYLDKTEPISLKNDDLINRIYQKYPYISKAEIASIVIMIFKCWRELLLLGKVINFNNLFFNTRLNFLKTKKGKPILKVKLKTPPYIRRKLGNPENDRNV